MVQVNANDLAVMGATPRWLMATLLLPEGSDRAMVESIFDQLSDACREHDITLVGGHTEVTYDLPRPIVAGAMLGEVAKDRVVLTSGAREGDSIVLTKGIAVEGTAILAREAAETLREAGVGEEVLARAARLLFEPGISVRREAEIACEAGARSMHDPTEGGLATGLLEMASASGLGLRVDAARIPVLPECRMLCDALGLDPMGLIASGSLLAAVPPDRAAGLIDALGDAGIEAWGDRQVHGAVGRAEAGDRLGCGGATQVRPRRAGPLLRVAAYGNRIIPRPSSPRTRAAKPSLISPRE